MIPIFGSINGHYLRDILLQATDKINEIDSVFAAVAYVTTKDILFNWCLENKVTLKFWGRYDHSIPVSILVLESFLKRRSANYQCKLVTKFHPKVIWWKGYGAYIGSANLTDAAWNSNVEAGCFFTEDEMDDNGLSNDLHEFFRVINENSFDLTDETLQHMRNIAHKVGLAKNRPVWIRSDVPESLIADQFLHAYYYNFTFDGKRANFEEHFERNQNDPEHAIQTAISWWKETQPPPKW